MFSIILPTYNRAETFLKSAIESVLNQSYQNWELLIIDNNSRDNTDDLVNSFYDKRIKLLKNYRIGNIARSRNIGIKKAKGEYIAFIDSDDFWETDKIEVCNNYLKENKNSGVCHAEYWLSDKNKCQIKIYGPEKSFTYENLLINGNCISLSAMIVPKSFFYKSGFFSENPDFISAEDYDLWIRFSKNKLKVGFINNCLGTFRVHGDSISSNIVKHTNAVNNVLLCYDYTNKSIAKSLLIAGKRLQLSGDTSLALRYYIKSFIRHKTTIKPFLYIISLLFPAWLYKYLKK